MKKERRREWGRERERANLKSEDKPKLANLEKPGLFMVVTVGNGDT